MSFPVRRTVCPVLPGRPGARRRAHFGGVVRCYLNDLDAALIAAIGSSAGSPAISTTTRCKPPPHEWRSSRFANAVR